jgi:hypothetical protein
VSSDFDERGSIQVPDIPGIRAMSAKLFPEPGVAPDISYLSVPVTAEGTGVTSGPDVAPPTGQPLTSGVKGCSYAPAPAPTRAPTAAPTAAPTVAPTPTATPAGTKGPKGNPTPTPAATAAP